VSTLTGICNIKEEQRNFILINEKDIIKKEIYNDISLRISKEEERIIKSNIKENIGKRYIPIVKKELYSELLESIKKEEKEKDKLKEKFRIIKEQEELENSKQQEKDKIIAGLSNENVEISNHCGTYFYIALNNYYPTRFQDAPNEVWNVRKNIWNFKDGDIIHSIYSRVKIMLANVNEINRVNNLKMNLIFIPIPASTNEKNTIRYRRFCSEVCKNLNIENGYNAINIKQDREALKGSIGANKILNLSFNTELFRDKTVILFDDVKTTGASFEQVGRALENKGARNIIGMFLGETYSEYLKGEPYWY
jgi:phosphoribosylpyrophosphate synthetase